MGTCEYRYSDPHLYPFSKQVLKIPVLITCEYPWMQVKLSSLDPIIDYEYKNMNLNLYTNISLGVVYIPFIDAYLPY